MRMRVNIRRSSTVIAVAMGALAVSLVNAPTASAGSGWDHVGTSEFTPLKAGDMAYGTGQVLSTGGDFKACIKSEAGSKYSYVLFEYDPDNADDVVAKAFRDADGCVTFRGIGEYVDGSNKRAEFYLRTDDHTAAAARFFD